MGGKDDLSGIGKLVDKERSHERHRVLNAGSYNWQISRVLRVSLRAPRTHNQPRYPFIFSFLSPREHPRNLATFISREFDEEFRFHSPVMCARDLEIARRTSRAACQQRISSPMTTTESTKTEDDAT